MKTIVFTIKMKDSFFDLTLFKSKFKNNIPFTTKYILFKFKCNQSFNGLKLQNKNYAFLFENILIFESLKIPNERQRKAYF